MKDGFTIASFTNRYKAAQTILLIALLAGCFSNYAPAFDGAIVVAFWLVLLYILAAHRRRIEA